MHPGVGVSPIAEDSSYQQEEAGPPSTPTRGRSSGTPSRELRRARIVITVKRTDSYKQWLEENPLQAIIAGDVEDDEDTEGDGEGVSPEDVQGH